MRNIASNRNTTAWAVAILMLIGVPSNGVGTQLMQDAVPQSFKSHGNMTKWTDLDNEQSPQMAASDRGPAFQLVAWRRPGVDKLGVKAGRAIDEWPAAQQADEDWEWVRILVFLVQIALEMQGFNSGRPDGLMGPDTMLAFLEWHKESGESVAPGLAWNVAHLLHATLTAIGLSPGPRDQILGQQSVAALERWDSTFLWGGVFMLVNNSEKAREIVMRDFNRAASSVTEGPAAAPQAATPSAAVESAPAQGELWGAYTGYNFDSFSDDDGYGVAWNYRSKEEAIAKSLKECKLRQPPFPTSDHKRCGDDTYVFSTSATPELITVEVPSERWYGFVRTWTYNVRCFAMVDVLQHPEHSSFQTDIHFGPSEEQIIAQVEDEFSIRYSPPYKIDQIVCNDR